MAETFTKKEIIDKLIGKIAPVGETNEDNRRLENLEVLIDIVGDYLYEISNVAEDRNRVEYSLKKAGETAFKFIKSLENYNE